MTTTYDPFHPKYLDESDLREELTRVYDLCHGCRLCFKFCSSFPSLFEMVDRHDDQDVSKLTPAEQDRVVDECFQCKLCYVNCPYTPDQHEWQLDFPRLMMRAEQVLHETRDRPLRERITDRALARTDLVGRVNSTLARPVNVALRTPGSRTRGLVEKVVGIASERILPPYARRRFSTWFRARRAAVAEPRRDRVALFATCMVEYQNVGIGHDTVKVCERNGIECTLPEGMVCCGAPALHQGDIDGFVELARKNVQVLSHTVREAADAGESLTIAALQPTCGYVLKFDYPDYVGGPDARLVADHTMDVTEYLLAQHKGEGGPLDTDFGGDVHETITYHAPCHLRAQNVGLKSRDLLKLTGAKVKVVAECSGIDGTWGLRAENIEASRKVATKMANAIEAAAGDVVAGDCTLANGGIQLETGEVPQHPIQLVARAYGIEPEPEVRR